MTRKQAREERLAELEKKADYYAQLSTKNMSLEETEQHLLEVVRLQTSLALMLNTTESADD